MAGERTIIDAIIMTYINNVYGGRLFYFIYFLPFLERLTLLTCNWLRFEGGKLVDPSLTFSIGIKPVWRTNIRYDVYYILKILCYDWASNKWRSNRHRPEGDALIDWATS